MNEPKELQALRNVDPKLVTFGLGLAVLGTLAEHDALKAAQHEVDPYKKQLLVAGAARDRFAANAGHVLLAYETYKYAPKLTIGLTLGMLAFTVIGARALKDKAVRVAGTLPQPSPIPSPSPPPYAMCPPGQYFDPAMGACVPTVTTQGYPWG